MLSVSIIARDSVLFVATQLVPRAFNNSTPPPEQYPSEKVVVGLVLSLHAAIIRRMGLMMSNLELPLEGMVSRCISNELSMMKITDSRILKGKSLNRLKCAQGSNGRTPQSRSQANRQEIDRNII
jgi:hypothetical protein